MGGRDLSIKTVNYARRISTAYAGPKPAKAQIR